MRGKNGTVRTEFYGGAFIVGSEDESGEVSSLFDGMAPIVIFVGIEFAEIVAEHVGELVAPTMAAIVDVQAIANGLIGGFLHLDIQRGVDAQAAFVNGFGAVGRFEILANVFKEVGREIVARVLEMKAERSLAGGFFFSRSDLPFFAHLVNDKIAAREGTSRIGKRRVNGPAHHAGEERCFLQLQIGDRLTKIKLRGGGEAVVTMSQINLVGVHGEDLRLGVAPLDLQAEQHFLGFAAEAAIAAIEEEVAGKLHGDGAGAFGFAVFKDIAVGGAGDAGEIDAPVIFEVLIFNSGDGVVENLGSLLPGHENATLQSEAANELTIVSVNFGDDVGAIGFEGANFREIAFVDEEESGSGADGDGTEEEESERDAVDEFPAAETESDGREA